MKVLIISGEYGESVSLEPQKSFAGMPLVDLKTATWESRRPFVYAALSRDDVRRLRDWLTEWLEETKQ